MCDTKITKKFSPKQEKFIEWLAVSKFDRVPATHQEFARKIGINHTTLSKWKRIPGFQDAVNERSKQYFFDKVPEYFAAMSREAIKGSYQHLDWVMKKAGEGNAAPGTSDAPYRIVIEYAGHSDDNPTIAAPRTNGRVINGEAIQRPMLRAQVGQDSVGD